MFKVDFIVCCLSIPSPNQSHLKQQVGGATPSATGDSGGFNYNISTVYVTMTKYGFVTLHIQKL